MILQIICLGPFGSFSSCLVIKYIVPLRSALVVRVVFDEAHFITGRIQTQYNRVCFFQSFNLVLASKGSN